MVRIITDSTAGFSPEELNRLRVGCVPIYVSLGDTEYTEDTLTSERFYELLARQNDAPRTSQPSPLAFQDLLQEAQNAGDEAVVITLSSTLSGLCQGAMIAKELLDYEQCYVVDGQTAVAGQRILVERAARLRDAGMGAAEIAAEIESLRSKVTILACADSLRYLENGGRLTALASGSRFSVKPVLSLARGGTLRLVSWARSMTQGVRSLCGRLEAAYPDNAYPMYVMYTRDRDRGEELAEELRRHGCSIPMQRIIGVGASIGSHVGPNACGVAYIEEHKRTKACVIL